MHKWNKGCWGSWKQGGSCPNFAITWKGNNINRAKIKVATLKNCVMPTRRKYWKKSEIKSRNPKRSRINSPTTQKTRGKEKHPSQK